MDPGGDGVSHAVNSNSANDLTGGCPCSAGERGGIHRIDNGLLLRSDVHRLFDAGYMTVTPDYQVHVSQRLRDDFHNGEQHLRLNGSTIWVPTNERHRPKRELLEWHADTKYRG